MGWLSEPFSFFFSRSQSCCDSIHYFLPIGQSDGYFFFVLHTQSLAGEEEAANSYTKNENFGLVEEKLGIWQIRI